MRVFVRRKAARLFTQVDRPFSNLTGISTYLLFLLTIPLLTTPPAWALSNVTVGAFGAVADGILRVDGAMTAGSAVLISASGSFSSADVGKYIQVIGAGRGGSSGVGSMAIGSNVLISSSGGFASSDVGRGIVVLGAGAGGSNLVTTIAGYQSPNTVTLSTSAGGSVSGATYYYGAMTLEGTIQSVQSATTVTLSTAAAATISNATYSYGTDNHAAFQSAVDSVGQTGGGTVNVPQPSSCPNGAVCGYVVKTSDQMTSPAPGAVKIRYNNVSLIGTAPQTNLFCRGAWATYFNSVKFPGQTGTIRGNCIAIGDTGGPNGNAGMALSNVTVANLHLYGMTNGNTYTNSYSPTDPPLTTTGDGWDETNKAIYIYENSAFSNITINSVVIQDFKGENIYSGGGVLTGIVISNSTLTNFNGDGISMLAADLQVLNNTISNGSNAAVENSSVGATGAALVRQLYQGNTISKFPREGITVVGVDSNASAGSIQIVNNYFDTIAQTNPSGAEAAIFIAAQNGGNNVAPGNLTITGNTCHDCLQFGILEAGPNVQVSGNSFIVDQYNCQDFLAFTFPFTNATISGNSGYLTTNAVSRGLQLTGGPYFINPGYATGNFQWNNLTVKNNVWNFPGSPNYTFVTTSGPGWNLVTAKNLIFQNESCQGCTYSDINHGVVNVGASPMIEPYGPVVHVVSSNGPVTATLDRTKEQDGSQIQIVNTGPNSVTFASDSNLSLPSPVTLPGNSNSSVTLIYQAATGKFGTSTSAAVAAPTFSLAAGTYSSSQTVSLSTATAGASIRYTTDGVTVPTETAGIAYSGAAIAVNATTTIKAIAYLSGMADSAVNSATYTINLPVQAPAPLVQVAAPIFSVAGGSYSAVQSVSLGSTTAGASIRYTTDGVTTPSETAGIAYTGTAIAINGTTTLQAIAYKNGMSDSAVTAATYIMNLSSGSSVVNLSGGSGWYGSGWGYKKAVGISHTQVSGTTNLANFPVLISLASDTDLAAHAQSSGNDILFTDSTGSNKLNHEIEAYNSATGQLTAWVQVPSVSPSTDTVIYMYFGNPSASNQQSKTAVWDANYQGVWHLPNGSTLNASDSTQNGNNGTVNNAAASSGEIGGGASFNGGSSVDFGSASGLHILGPITAEAWINLAAWPSNGYPSGILGMGYSYTSQWTGWMLEAGTDNAGTHYLNWTSNNGAPHGVATVVPSLALGTWHHLVGTFDGGTWRMYLDGVMSGSSADAIPPVNSGDDIVAGGLGTNASGPIFMFKGLLDELRVSNTARSSGWVATEYNNQSHPGSFVSLGSLQTGGGGTAPTGTIPVNVTSSPVGLAFQVDGATYTSAQTFQWTAGASHTIGVASGTQAGGAGIQNLYASWSDGGTQSHTVTVPSSSITYTANFTTQYFLTTAAGTGGTINPGNEWVNKGTVVSVTASANSGYQFSSFTGAVTGTANPASVTMNAPASVTANFTTSGSSLVGSSSSTITSSSTTTSSAWYNSAWSYQKAITISHAQVSGPTSLTNFPVLISLTADSDLAAHALSSGNDILFTDSSGTAKINHEIEAYNPSTGQLTAWVQVPSVSPTTDTTIYMYFGNGSAGNQQSRTAVWDANYQGVWHLPNGTALNASDSTSNGSNGTVSNSAAGNGEIGGGASFNGSNASVDFGSAAGLHITGPITTEAWINVAAWPANGYPSGILGMGYSYASQWTGWMLEANTDNGGNHYLNWTSNNGSPHGVATSAASLASGTWHHLVGTFDGATWKMYLDGVVTGSVADATPPVNTGVDVVAGGLSTNGFGTIFLFRGLLDELRVSNTARSAGWIATEYSNQSNPGNFLSVGSAKASH